MINRIHKGRRSRGFTMAEMLIVVAIIAVLSGVAFIAVERHQRGLAQLERNAIAKEIFFAAQNHLTMAENQGYLGVKVDDFGTPDNSIGKDVYYLTNGGSAPGAGTMLELMLPFGSIDETVRSGGSYLIVYQANPAVVLDVFYCSVSGSPARFNYTSGALPYDTFMGNKDAEGKGSNLPKTGYVVGWYGGGDTGVSGTYITAPSMEIENGDRLIVKVKDANLNLPKDPSSAEAGTYNAKLVLIVSGETVEGKTAKMVFVLRDPDTAGFTPNPRVTADPNGTDFTIVLDDITTRCDPLSKDGMHFADLNKYANTFDNNVWFMSETDPATGATSKSLFRPGEDITVEAVAFSNEVLTNIAYSNAVMANSLFADSIVDPSAGSGLSGTDEGHANVNIANIRHLENLDASISKYQYDTFMSLSSAEQVSATQVADLDWNAFADANGAQVYAVEDASEDKKEGFQPVSPAYKLAYNGRETRTVGETTLYVQHSIKNISVDVDGAAGLFGSVAEGSTLSNLELIDFSVKSATGDAGALAGTLANNVTVTNVTAYNTEAFAKDVNITSGTGSVGGLVGSTNGATLEKSAAALVVNSTSGTGSAGGLVGATQGGTISGCYAGGHTKDGAYTGVIEGDNAGKNFNVTASGGSAGGLIGSAGATTVEYSYSTCSATGATAGGFAGTASGGSIETCYATGLVYGKTASEGGAAAEGAFAGSSSGTSYGNCKYYEIVNERKVTSTDGTAFNYLPPLGGGATSTGIAALDASASAYNAFVGAPADWDDATAYDAQLATYYGGKYNLPTVDRLGYVGVQAAEGSEPVAAGQPAAVIPDFVATHRGDWPAPEIFVENE